MGRRTVTQDMISSFRSKIEFMKQQIIADQLESVELRTKEAAKLLERHADLTEEQKVKLENYVKVTDLRKTNAKMLSEVVELARPISLVADVAVTQSKVLNLFEKDTEKIAAAITFAEQIVEMLGEFFVVTKEMGIFDDEGFNLNAKSMQMKLFKQEIDKIWNYSRATNS